jgi:hypothetical protein
MQWSDIPRDPPERTLRQFAGLWLVFFGALAAWHGFARDHSTRAILLAGMALAVGVAGLLRPSRVRPVFVGAMIAAFPIGWLVSKILLAFVYYAFFAPIALAFRMAGRDVLARWPDPAATTYWAVKPAPAGLRSYFRQF